MYRVYCDNYLLYHSKLENLKIFNPSLELELNKTGSFDFTIYQDHPYYGFIQKLKSIIRVYQDDYLLFRGRVLDDEVGWYNQRQIACEGELAFFFDSVQRPFSYSGTVEECFVLLVENHNTQVEAEKRFEVGTVTVQGSLSLDITDYPTTFDTLQKSLIEAFGGYLYIRHVDGISYIDYLAEINLLAPQSIEFGKNLMDLKRIRKGGEIYTGIIPLGAKLKDAEGQDTSERLTIKEVNNYVDYIADEEAKAEYSLIVKPVIFEDITDATALLAAGQAYLPEVVNQWETVELTAADMATVDKNILSFHLGTQVNVISKPHGLNQRFLVSKLSLKLFDPASNKLVLGKTSKAFSDAIKGVYDRQSIILDEVNKSVKAASEAVYNVERNVSSTVQATGETITATVAETYTLKEDAEALVSSVSTELTTTKESFEIQFKQFNADINAVAAGVDAEFEEIRKYIRFVDGKVYIGEEGNELELQIANDRISFMQDGAEVAYFSNRKLYITDTQITHSLQLGNFAFMPRANGNISFKKI